MLKRWNVHHGAQNLGLMTAREIRDGLRRGTLDPFDKVSAEDSNIREELIEVDEIFKDSEEDEQKSPGKNLASAGDGRLPQSFPAAHTSFRHPIQDTNVAVLPPASHAFGMTPDEAQRKNTPQNIASYPWPSNDSAAIATPKDDKDSRSTQKRYYLIDKAQILGPISALEIQSLFNRGGLSQKVKVQKVGGTKAIPLSQFITSFSEDRIKELTEDGKLNQKVSSPSSKVLNELSRAANAQKIAKNGKQKTFLILGLAAFLLAAAILVIVDSSQPTKRTTSEEPEDENKKGRPRLLQRPQDNDREPELIRPRAAGPEAASPKASTPRTERREIPEPQIRRRPPPPKPSLPASAPVRAPIERKALVQPTPKPPSELKAKTAPPATRIDRESPINRALSSGGGVQTVGPLSFSIAALDACPSKCTLTLRDLSGVSIKAVFFKTAYYDQLKKSGGSIFVSGTVRKEGSGASILIQDVR